MFQGFLRDLQHCTVEQVLCLQQRSPTASVDALSGIFRRLPSVVRALIDDKFPATGDARAERCTSTNFSYSERLSATCTREKLTLRVRTIVAESWRLQHRPVRAYRCHWLTFEILFLRWIACFFCHLASVLLCGSFCTLSGLDVFVQYLHLRFDSQNSPSFLLGCRWTSKLLRLFSTCTKKHQVPSTVRRKLHFLSASCNNCGLPPFGS